MINSPGLAHCPGHGAGGGQNVRATGLQLPSQHRSGRGAVCGLFMTIEPGASEGVALSPAGADSPRGGRGVQLNRDTSPSLCGGNVMVRLFITPRRPQKSWNTTSSSFSIVAAEV